MPYAVEMFFDKESDGYIRGLWRTLKESGISSYMHDSDNVPHITLSVFKELDTTDADKRLVAFTEKVSKFKLVFLNLGAFPTDEGVLLLAPIVTEELLRVHKTFHDLFDDLKQNQMPYYLPGSWIPHCTLSLNIPREKVHEALDAVIRTCKPIIAEVDRVGLVEYHPVKVLKEYKFKD